MKSIQQFNNLDITITDIPIVVYRQKTADFSRHMTNRKHFGLVFMESGSLIYTINDNEYIVRPGELILLNKNDDYYVTVNTCETPNTLFKFYSIHFDIVEQAIPLLSRITRTQNYNALLKLIQKLYNHKSKESFDRKILCKAIFYQILSEIYNAYYSATIISPTQKNLERSKHFIEEHYMDKITVETVCQFSGYSPTHFKRLFHQYYGMAPIEYITMIRLEKAKPMLLSGLFNLAEIAEECGFSTEYYFSRIFKKHVGCPPSKYRLFAENIPPEQ